MTASFLQSIWIAPRVVRPSRNRMWRSSYSVCEQVNGYAGGQRRAEEATVICLENRNVEQSPTTTL